MRRSRLRLNRSSARVAVIALAASLIGASASAVPGTLPRGDVNKDGRFDGADALVLFRYLRGDAAVVLDDESLWAADVGPVVAAVSTPDKKVSDQRNRSWNTQF